MKPRQPVPQDPTDPSLSFGAFYERHWRIVQRSLLNKVGRRLEAEDLTELVFMKALVAWDRCPYPEPNRMPWLLRITRNVAIDYRRSSAKSQTISLSEYVHLASREDPFKEIEGAAIRASYAQALSHLTDRQRQIAVRFFEGFSLREVALELGLTEGAIKSTVYRVRQILRQDPGLARWAA